MGPGHVVDPTGRLAIAFGSVPCAVRTAAELQSDHAENPARMVTVWVSFRAQAHKRAEIISAIDELIERIRRSAGCIRVRLYADSEDPYALTLLSEWGTGADAEAFFDSKDFHVFRGIRILLRGEPLIIFDEVQARVTRLFR